MAVAEARRTRPGSRSVQLRIAELVFVEVLRSYLTTGSGDQQGWLGGLRDPVVGRALACLHGQPAREWTLAALAHEVGASRSVLAARFADFVGHPPMLYLTRWRMQLAANRLAAGAGPVSAIATEVGYESEAAFGRAFKRSHRRHAGLLAQQATPRRLSTRTRPAGAHGRAGVLGLPAARTSHHGSHNVNGTADRHAFDRRLFLAAAVLFPLIVLLGFAPTYYLKGLFGGRPLPSAYVHVHGLTMSAWVLLFIVQVRLISEKSIRLHQRLGYAGIGLAALVILTGIPVAIRAAKYGSVSAPPDIPPLAFMLIPLVDLVVFGLLFGAAVYYRKQAAAHKGLMLLAAIGLLPPAVARIPIAALQALGPLWFFGLPAAIAIVTLILNARRYGHVNRVFRAGVLVLIGSYVARLAVMTTGIWMRTAEWLVGFV